MKYAISDIPSCRCLSGVSEKWSQKPCQFQGFFLPDKLHFLHLSDNSIDLSIQNLIIQCILINISANFRIFVIHAATPLIIPYIIIPLFALYCAFLLHTCPFWCVCVYFFVYKPLNKYISTINIPLKSDCSIINL